MKRSDRIKKQLQSKPKKAKPDLLSSGSTLLNLACADITRGAFPKGTYVFFVGDSSSGKTFFSLTCLAEAANSKAFENYRLIYDDVEGGALMNLEKFFGASMADRLEPPSVQDGEAVHSYTIEDFYFHLDDALSEGPCIYVLDSMDALSSTYEGKKFDEKKKKGDQAKGDYGDGKAKINASGMRQCMAKLRDTGSILFVINQTRDNVGGGLFDPKKTRSGGHALTFYAHTEIWASVGKQLTKDVAGKKRHVGVLARLNVKKSRVNGKLRQIEVPIHYSYGIDDIGSCIDFLIESKVWEKNKQGYIGPIEDFDSEEPVKLRRNKLIAYIEENELESDLYEITSAAWKSIEAQLTEKRKKRYS